jgi:hypothetical protein
MDQLGQAVEGIEVSIPSLNRSVFTNGDGAFGFGYENSAQGSLPGGLIEIVTNPGLSNSDYGSDVRRINIRKGRRSDLGMTRLIQLNVETPFQPITSGQTNVVLAGGELTLNLSQTSLTFPQDGTSSGNVHVSFLTLKDANIKYLPGSLPNWLFGVQPAGIKVQGNIGLKFKMPRLFGSMAYVPANDSYVVLVGRDANSDTMVPVGVGQINNYQVTSVGSVNLQRLDYLGYAIIAEEQQPLLVEFANGQRDLNSLIGALQGN